MIFGSFAFGKHIDCSAAGRVVQQRLCA
jgi:hypothetical protein